MPGFEQGDVVRVPFPYTDRSTIQRRPGLVISAGGVGEDEALLWIAMITSAENRPWPGDVSLSESYMQAGLPLPSVIRSCKIATIDARLAEPLGRIGRDQLMNVLAAVFRHLGVRPQPVQPWTLHEP